MRVSMIRRTGGLLWVALIPVPPPGDVLRGVIKDRGQISRQRVEQMDAVLEIETVRIERDLPRGCPARAATSSACAARTGFVDGFAPAPVISARIGLGT